MARLTRLDLLEAWVRAHGSLQGVQAQKFLERDEVAELLRFERPVALAAVAKERKLVAAVAEAHRLVGCPHGSVRLPYCSVCGVECRHGELTRRCRQCWPLISVMPEYGWRIPSGHVFHLRKDCGGFRRANATPTRVRTAVAWAGGLRNCRSCIGDVARPAFTPPPADSLRSRPR